MPTPVEDYTKCLFGRTDVRMGTRVIATFNIVCIYLSLILFAEPDLHNLEPQ